MHKKLSLIILLLFVFIFNSGFVIAGHRGDPFKAPEETFQSIDDAYSDGAEYVELDVHESSDKQLIVSHDDNLQRVTGVNAVVEDNPASYLTQLTQANGEHIYTISQLFAHYQSNPNAKFIIETKTPPKNRPHDEETLLVSAIKKYHMQNRILVHSFSAVSLEKMQELMPEIPRIFIAGSLKRLNFDTFQYSNAVNISSSLLTPQLVDQLHGSGQKVFVWDEMNENPKQWNWLVNLPIDGIVTNYPATAKHYKDLKNSAKQSDSDFDAIYTRNSNQDIYENPYSNAPKKDTLQPLDNVHVQKLIHSDDADYFQIDDNRFVNAIGFVQTDIAQRLLPFLNQTAQLKNHISNSNLLSSPLDDSFYNGSVNANKHYHVTGLQNTEGTDWVQLNNHGWIKADKMLFNLNSISNKDSFILNQYLNTPSHRNNINLRAAIYQAPMYIKNDSDNSLPKINFIKPGIPDLTQINNCPNLNQINE